MVSMKFFLKVLLIILFFFIFSELAIFLSTFLTIFSHDSDNISKIDYMLFFESVLTGSMFNF